MCLVGDYSGIQGSWFELFFSQSEAFFCQYVLMGGKAEAP